MPRPDIIKVRLIEGRSVVVVRAHPPSPVTSRTLIDNHFALDELLHDKRGNVETYSLFISAIIDQLVDYLQRRGADSHCEFL